ncbi:hypothetical protein [Paraliomyxa miuraensis]|uniref:hypothetical protein n=1 Tax=Paraliomyxa miuraensis TaxID=376150 RepID=UPI002258D9B8|nr:hypothetical protein [Paraliomyxa miuraensis]MCX4241040.1 hypothetical protein [Paraliomyxa miuraensis]
MASFGLLPDSDSTEPPPASTATPSGRFAAHCLQWARDDERLQTEAVPGNALPHDGPDLVHFEGHTARPTRAPELAYGGFLGLTAAWIVLVIADRLRAPAVLDGGLLRLAGWGLLVLACLVMLAAWLIARRARSPVMAMIDTSEDPVTEQELRSWQGRGRGRLWVFSQRGFEGSAVAFALAAGIRCLSPAGAAFVDTGAQQLAATPTAARGPRERRPS